ncbi:MULTISPECIES: hypothetical protein [Streptomyces]|uniref:Uncharacterized protein n=1 Tax=Streptomyces ramulosus TaxID=47762 RepID=A0ABW1FMZ2_9ACTN
MITRFPKSAAVAALAACTLTLSAGTSTAQPGAMVYLTGPHGTYHVAEKAGCIPLRDPHLTDSVLNTTDDNVEIYEYDPYAQDPCDLDQRIAVVNAEQRDRFDHVYQVGAVRFLMQ